MPSNHDLQLLFEKALESLLKSTDMNVRMTGVEFYLRLLSLNENK